MSKSACRKSKPRSQKRTPDCRQRIYRRCFSRTAPPRRSESPPIGRKSRRSKSRRRTRTANRRSRRRPKSRRSKSRPTAPASRRWRNRRPRIPTASRRHRPIRPYGRKTVGRVAIPPPESLQHTAPFGNVRIELYCGIKEAGGHRLRFEARTQGSRTPGRRCRLKSMPRLHVTAGSASPAQITRPPATQTALHTALESGSPPAGYLGRRVMTPSSILTSNSSPSRKPVPSSMAGSMRMPSRV